MTQFIFYLSLPVSLFSILNKVYLVLGKRSGWFWGAMVGLSSTIYFFLIGLKILSIAEIGFLIVMIYGYINHHRDEQKLSLYTSLLLSFISLVLAVLLFTNYLTIIETTSSLAFIWGGYTLANRNYRSGWFLFIVAHTATSISSLNKGQQIFSILQIVSALICLYGFVIPTKKQIEL
jgi:hypothetical protein